MKLLSSQSLLEVHFNAVLLHFSLQPELLITHVALKAKNLVGRVLVQPQVLTLKESAATQIAHMVTLVLVPLDVALEDFLRRIILVADVTLVIPIGVAFAVLPESIGRFKAFTTMLANKGQLCRMRDKMSFEGSTFSASIITQVACMVQLFGHVTALMVELKLSFTQETSAASLACELVRQLQVHNLHVAH